MSLIDGMYWEIDRERQENEERLKQSIMLDDFYTISYKVRPQDCAGHRGNNSLIGVYLSDEDISNIELIQKTHPRMNVEDIIARGLELFFELDEHY